MRRKAQPDPQRYSVLREMPRKIHCKSCRADSGIQGEWKRAPHIAEELRKRGWHLFHCGHLVGRDADPRGWICPRCTPTWRDGLAMKDAEKIHGPGSVQARQGA